MHHHIKKFQKFIHILGKKKGKRKKNKVKKQKQKKKNLFFW